MNVAPLTLRERLCYYEGMYEAFNKLLKHVTSAECKEKLERNVRSISLEIIRLSNKVDANEMQIKDFLEAKKELKNK